MKYVWPTNSIEQDKKKLLAWAAEFPFAAIYDNAGSDIDRYGQFEYLIGIGTDSSETFTSKDSLARLPRQWIMGMLPYSLKNHYEPGLSSRHEAWVSFPDLALFAPECVIGLSRDSLSWRMLKGNQADAIAIEAVLQGSLPEMTHLGQVPTFHALVDEAGYMATIEKLRAHIKAGDFYEINLAQAFVAEEVSIPPASIFARLMEISPVPFGAFIKFRSKFLICASPERFLQRKGPIIRSQPIKGTAPRSKDPQKDALHATYLIESLKERAENVMIVDLTRNDLNRSCDPFSVHVPHLFEIQAFPQVYQMVSTVEGRLLPDISNAEIWGHTFPPGSMTGAPKVRSMQMIDQYEPIGRGIYAGSAGYIEPGGDFDWNVIIRSLVYDAAIGRLVYQVGGAITYDSDPAAEYQETLLKAKAIRRIWEG